MKIVYETYWWSWSVDAEINDSFPKESIYCQSGP